MQPTKLLSLAAAVSIVFLSCQREIDFDTLPPTPPPPPPVLNMPVIISFAPDSVRVNEEVIIKGKFFDPVITNNQVSVNGTGGTVLSANDSMVRFKVNTGSTTGKITLVTGGQTVITATNLPAEQYQRCR